VTVVLSDLDGVLVDSHASIVRAWRRWGRAHGVEREAIDAVRHGSPTNKIVGALAPQLDVAAEARALARARAEDTADVVALPGAADMLRTFGPDAVGVVTSCTAELAEDLAAAHERVANVAQWLSSAAARRARRPAAASGSRRAR